jgi:hypothetical protein
MMMMNGKNNSECKVCEGRRIETEVKRQGAITRWKITEDDLKTGPG